MAANMQQHVQHLAKLCRVCGEYLGKRKCNYNVSDRINDLNQFLFLNVEKDSAEAHPTKICSKCYARIKNIRDRSTTTKHEHISWIPHSDNCRVCKEGSSRKGGKPIPKAKSGRPKAGKKLWRRKDFEEFLSMTPENEPAYDLGAVKPEHNAHLNLCLCPMCHNLLSRPVLLSCQHAYCLSCLIKKFEGKTEEEAKCPFCGSESLVGTIRFSKHHVEMLKCLRVACDKHCGKLFPLKSKAALLEHQTSCFPKTTLTPLFEKTFNLDNSIPREIEDVAVQVIQHKIANSRNPIKSIEFKTGGSRVCIYGKAYIRM